MSKEVKIALSCIFVAIIIASILAYMFLSQISLTGKVIALEKAAFAKGEIIRSNFTLRLHEGELIPADALVTIEFDELTKEISLQEWLNLSNSSLEAKEGNFYVKGKALEGVGLGYGWQGFCVEYPEVSFKFKISSEPSSTNNSSVNKTVNETSETGAINDSSTKQSSNQQNVKIIEASCTAKEPFYYELAEGEIAELVPGSVSVDGQVLNDSTITITEENGTVKVTTDYVIGEPGFGENCLTDVTNEIVLPLDLLQLKAVEEGSYTLTITLSAQGQELVKESMLLMITEKALEPWQITKEELRAVEGKQIEDDPAFETTIWKASRDNEAGIFTLLFSHDSPEPQPVWIEPLEGSLEYDLSTNVAATNEKVTLIVYFSKRLPKFRLHVGNTSDVFEFGDPLPLEVPGPCECINCSDCIAKLNDLNCSVVYLTEDITDYSGTCIDNPENFSNKTFDCQGHLIDGTRTSGNYGIYLSGKTNNTIKNCRITEFDKGIYLNSSSNNTLINNTASNNNNSGIYLNSSSNNSIQNNAVCDNEVYDIYLDSSSNNNTGDNKCDNLQDDDANEVQCSKSCPKILLKSTPAPWLPGWSKRIKLTVNSTKIDENLTWFPITVFLKPGNGDTAKVFDEVGANYLKIAIADTSNPPVQYYVEVEYWNATNHIGILHFGKEGTVLPSNTDKNFYLYYDFGHSNNTEYVGVEGSTAARKIWESANIMTQHMNDNPDNAHIRDSTSNQNNGTKKAANEPSEVDGKIAKAQKFDGVDDYVNCGNDESLNVNETFTVEAWIKSTKDIGYSVISKGAYFTNFQGWHISTANNPADLLFEISNGSARAHIRFYIGREFDWTHIVAVRDGNKIYTYANGVLKDQTETTIGSVVNTLNLMLGREANTLSYWFNGTIDEVRIYNRSLSAAEIKASYYSTNDSLLSYGSEEVKPWLSGWSKRIKLTVNSTKIDENLTWFPITVFLKPGNGDTAKVFDEVGANKYKIAIVDNSRIPYYVEIEQWDEVNKTGILHFGKEGTILLSSSDKVFYLYYDKGHEDNTDYVGETESKAAQKVWESANVMTQHMKDYNASYIKDSTKYGNDGAKIGNTTEVDGKIGKAQSFDGDCDYVDAGNGSSLNITGPLTVEAWIYRLTDWNTSHSRYVAIVYKNSVYESGYGLHVYERSPITPEFWIRDSSGHICVGPTHDVTWGVGEWVHLTGVYNGSTVFLYEDGILKASKPTDKTPGSTSKSLLIGWGHDSKLLKWIGFIDEIRIYNRSLSAAEIKASYYSTNDSLLSYGSEEVGLSIQFVPPTTQPGAYSQNWIAANVTAVNFSEIKIYLYNSTDLVNSTQSTSSPLFVNFTDLADGTYYLNATAEDAEGNIVKTETRTITLDTVAPQVAINSPLNQSYHYSTTSVVVNFTINEQGTCWFGDGTSNYTMDTIDNLNFNATYLVSSGNSYTIYAYCNDTAGNNNFTQSVTFSVNASSKILLERIYPTTNISVKRNEWFNITLNVTCVDVDCGDINVSFNFVAWKYKRNINISNSGSALSDYQVLVTLDTQSLIAEGKMRDDCGDIRFRDSDEKTNLSYWLESGCNTGSTKLWVKVPSIPAGSKTIYIYYGNPDAINKSNGTTTFDFFDDFEGTSLDTEKWVAYSSNYSVADSILRINRGGIERAEAFSFNIQDGYMAETRVRHEVSAANYGGNLPEVASSRYTASGNSEAAATILYMRQYNSDEVRYWIGDGSARGYNVGYGPTGWTAITGIWYITGISVNGGTLKLWRDGIALKTFTGIGWAKNLTYVKLGSFHRDSNYDLQDTSYDWIRVRKFADPEPTTSIGAEEGSKELIPTTPGAKPFYTNSTTNPVTINLNESQSRLVTFWVNATGKEGTTHTFFEQANLISDPSVGNSTERYKVAIANQPPSKVQLYSPPSGNVTFERILTFVWNNSVDPENDSLTYQFQLSNSSNFSTLILNVSNITETEPRTNYTPTQDLPTDILLYWRVRAFDGFQFGEWSDIWNLTVQSSLIVSLPINLVDFGVMNPGESNDTEDNLPPPLLLRNDGNIVIDSIVSGTDLWTVISNPSSYYQYKIGINETGSFNETLSTMTWTNMSSENAIVDIAELKYRDESDTAEIELKITVPGEEPPGPKNSTITIASESAEK